MEAAQFAGQRGRWLAAMVMAAVTAVVFIVGWGGGAPASAAPSQGGLGVLTETPELTRHVYLPLAVMPVPPPPVTTTELRAVWVSRYDWTRFGVSPTVTNIHHVVDQAARAGFNAVFFQVRGAGDAYYGPGLEPWAARMTGTLGRDPGWDPLAELIWRAHAAGLQVHAWFNVYPAWLAPPSAAYGLITPTLDIWPPQMLNRFTYGRDGGYGLGYTWRVYDRAASDGYMRIAWGQYLWASPAVPQVQDHIAAVVADVVARYALDGVHLDNVRYPGVHYSLDPFTLAAYESDPLSQTLSLEAWRPDFQRAQVGRLVARIRAETHAANPSLTVSAAVWPSYPRGYAYYYQDSQGWLASGAVDAIAPMLYSSDVITDLVAWTAAAADFQAQAGAGGVVPGIGVTLGSGQCVSFDKIAARIAAARGLGMSGQAVFSLSGLEGCGYIEALRSGPYAAPAAVDIRHDGLRPFPVD